MSTVNDFNCHYVLPAMPKGSAHTLIGPINQVCHRKVDPRSYWLAIITTGLKIYLQVNLDWFFVHISYVPGPTMQEDRSLALKLRSWRTFKNWTQKLEKCWKSLALKFIKGNFKNWGPFSLNDRKTIPRAARALFFLFF